MDFDGLQAALNARDDVQRSGWLGPIQIQIEIIAKDSTITSRLVVSHVGMRFVGWVRACPPRVRVINYQGQRGAGAQSRPTLPSLALLNRAAHAISADTAKTRS